MPGLVNSSYNRVDISVNSHPVSLLSADEVEFEAFLNSSAVSPSVILDDLVSTSPFLYEDSNSPLEMSPPSSFVDDDDDYKENVPPSGESLSSFLANSLDLNSD
jgi:hypothetical protein